MKQITIIGLGLIGGSLAAASRKAFPGVRIIGVSRSRTALAKAKKRKWIDKGSCDLKKAVPSSDLVVLCTPVDTMKGILKQIERFASSNVLVADTGSVKGALVRWADRQRWQRVSFVGCHPMAGSHERGIDAAKPDLFKSALTFITPGRKTSRKAQREVAAFWKRISSRVVVVSPEEHDRLTAEISHFPHLIASLMVMTASQAALPYATTGFCDSTRVAQGDPSIWTPIFLENQRELGRLLLKFEAALRQVKKILRKGDVSKLRHMLLEAQVRRASL